MMWRLFISVNLSDILLTRLADVQNQLRRQLSAYPLRWTRPESIHITLKFLGETDSARLAELETALQKVAVLHNPFVITIGGLGCFPNTRRPNVLWVGVNDPEKRLQALAARVDQAMTRLGWEEERRPFNGHLTLARVKREAGSQERRQLGAELMALDVPETLGTCAVNSVHLMRSQLRPQGALYTSLHEFRLGHHE
ncbi:MAG: RNA 2',3'-cyclic phosphodiesterase [Chloroflexi bacterium]|nr:RNA 2',3'-cyclic phosphodiesterase [Chloroflexota bacterium]